VTLEIEHCVIAVTDWKRSNAFYRDVLFAEVVERGTGYVYQLGNQFLSVHGPGMEPAKISSSLAARDPVRPGNSDLCFVWSGLLTEALEHLRRHDVPIELGPFDGTNPFGRPCSNVYFRDPDGSLLEFVSYHHHHAAP
jgi:catechol 2,3-dioxygenase-like lactoylglutathione lyase family enzyme